MYIYIYIYMQELIKKVREETHKHKRNRIGIGGAIVIKIGASIGDWDRRSDSDRDWGCDWAL